jgi:hypothetical protein
MALVLTQNEKSAARITYDDRLGASYEFPKKYQKLVVAGECFVYYQGKRGIGGAQVPHYFGTGVTGEVTPASDGRLRCAIRDHRAFDSVVQFKQDGRYLEPAANGRTPRQVGLYFRTGVRVIGHDTFDEICAIGLVRRAVKKRTLAKFNKASTADPKITDEADSAVYALAMTLAMAEAKRQWPTGTLFRAPASQQFSLAVRLSGGETRHIAVRGTAESKPLIHLSAADISFSRSHAANYSVWAFYDLDLERGAGKFLSHDGTITERDVDLEAALHGGKLRTRKAGKKVGPIPG